MARIGTRNLFFKGRLITMFLDPEYFMIVGPAFLLAMWAQFRVKSAFNRANQVPARLSGAAAARHVLDSAGLHDVDIELTPGHLSDHYDPSANVVRLSEPVYHGHTQAAVGIAAHEVGHAMQKAQNYVPLVIRNAAVPAASFGSNTAMAMVIFGALLSVPGLIKFGIIAFAAVVFFQVVNLPVEFNASSRAKKQLVGLGIVAQDEMKYVNSVLNAAALTYVAATLQAILTLLYLITQFGDRE